MSKSPVKAIPEFCLECCGGSAKTVRECPSSNCALYAFRFGKNPYINRREMSEEEKEAARLRLEKARERKQGE